MILVYYHIAQMGDWKEIVSEQTERLKESGLYDAASKICVGTVGSQKTIENLPPKFEIVAHNRILGYGEIPTLEALRQHALKVARSAGESGECGSPAVPEGGKDNFTVLYMHTKGVSWQEQGYNREAMTAWRKYLEHFCINKWRECSSLLNKHDAVSCEYVAGWETKKGSWPCHFRGNFWWSKSSYLRSLPPLINVAIPTNEVRRKAEYWLGSNPDFKPMSIFNLKGEYGERGYLYHHILNSALYMENPPSTTPP